MGCIVLVLGVGRCAFRPPRVVFVLGLVSLINSLTSGKKRNHLLPLSVCSASAGNAPGDVCLVCAARARSAPTGKAGQETLTMSEAKYEAPDTSDTGSARDLLAKFDKIENPNSPTRKPKSPKQKQAPKDIYKPKTLGELSAEGKGVSSSPFLQIDKDYKKKVKEETPSAAGVYMSKASTAQRRPESRSKPGPTSS